jgi:single-stranded-DNA-specific exonuclease
MYYYGTMNLSTTKIIFKNEIKLQDKLDTKTVLDLIIKSRNIKDLDQFLKPPSPLDLTLEDFGPYKKPFEKVINILKEIKEKNQMIVVYTDYDADGITGGAILWETLHLLGFKVRPYVPDRKTEGYGYSKKGIDNCIKQFNPSLIITVDHGITKIKEVEYAKLKKIKTIITDHHLKGEDVPKAEAIFHIPALSGSGVAYFFAKEIFLSFGSKTMNYELLTTTFSTDYLSLAAIGTIADLVPLTGPSRSVVKFGLDAFPKIKRFGIKHILKQAGIQDKKITPYEVGFMIAPRINAIGRLEHAIDALRLLCTNDEKKAYDLSHKIGNINVERQEMVEKAADEAKKIIFKKYLSNKLPPTNYTLIPNILILVSDHWHEGIIGLIASKIAEEFYRPTLVLTKTEFGYKGSARSIPSFHITKFLRSLKEYIIDAGGHKQAAGFTLEKKQLYSFETAAQELSSKLISDKDLERKIEADLKIPISKINLELVEALSSLEPFGIGNPRPVFYSEGILTGAQLIGKTQKHLKLFISGLSNQITHNQASIEFLVFNSAEKFKELSRGQKIKIVYNLDINEWNNKKTVQGKIISLILFV